MFKGVPFDIYHLGGLEMKATIAMLLCCMMAPALLAGDHANNPSSLADAQQKAATANKPLLVEFYYPT